MKTKKILAVTLAVMMILSAAPLGGLVDTNWSEVGIKASAEEYYNGLYYEIENDEVTITGCDDSVSGELIIPDEIEGYPVTKIGASAFYECENLTDIIIPNSIVSIDAWAFAICESLKSINIPDSMTSIGDYAFHACESLSDIEIPDSVETIGEWAFSNCKSLSSVKIGSGIAIINDSTFSGCRSLSNVKIGSNVTKIGDYAFIWCGNLTEIELPNSVTSIGKSAFWYCTSLTDLKIPNSITSIGNGAFYNCNFSSIKIPDSVENIGEYAFGYYHSDYDDSDYHLVDGFVIYAHMGTAAETYAIDNGITFIAITCDHINTTRFEKVEAKSCAEPGYTAGVYCNDCENWIEGHEKIIIPHTDEDGDNICDVCKIQLNDITVGKTKNIEIEEGEIIKYLKFIPTLSGTYTFKSISDDDTYGYIFDENKEELTHNDDDGGGRNFSITYHLEKGETYYFGASFFDGYSGSLNVLLTLDEIDCDHINTTRFEKVEAKSCAEPGYTAGVYCNDCENWIEGHKAITVPHTDEDSNGICDVCKIQLNDITVGETKNIEIEEGEITYLKFIPTLSGTYTFKSISYEDTYGYIFDENKEELTHNDDGYDSDFSITYRLEKGETYYFGARFYDEYSGSLNVLLTLDEIDCDHINTTRFEKVEAKSCAEPGYTAGVYCNDCESWIEGHEEITIPHTDENGDNICEVCGKDIREIIDSGSCGDNATYVLYNDGELVISGEGEIKPSAFVNDYDGYEYYESIKCVKIGHGITSVGEWAFGNCINITSIELPSSIISLDDYAFVCCLSLSNVDIPDGITSIGDEAFFYCEFTNVEIPASVTEIGKFAFGYYFGSDEGEYAKTEGFSICGYKNTAAEAYANENGFEFITLESHTHSFGDWSVSKPATCLEAGVEERACTGCEEKETREIQPLGHSCTVLQSDSANHWYKCERCDDISGKEAHNGGTATCTQKAVCSVCEAEYGTSLGHSFTNYVSDNNATCLADGTKTAKCNRCTETNTLTDTGSKKSHSYTGEVKANNDGTHSFKCVNGCNACGGTENCSGGTATCTQKAVCSVCEAEYGTSLGHSFTNYVSDNNATCLADGTKTAKCDRCEATDTVTDKGSKLGHSYKTATTKATLTKSGKIETKCSVCGKVSKTTTIYYPKTFTLSATNFTYTGKEIKPTVTVKDSNGKVIASSNYTVSYSENTNSGTGKVTIKFKGNYSGTKTVNFTITPKQVTGLKVSDEKTTSLKLTWSKTGGAKYYKVEQSTDGKKWKTLTTTDKTSYTVKSLKAGTKYQFRVTALDSTKKIAGKASSVLKTGTLTSAPTLTLKSTKSKTATVSWKKVTGASKYVVYKSTNGKKWTKVTTTTKTSYNLTKLTGGKKIYVKVAALNAYGEASAYSSSKNITVKK